MLKFQRALRKPLSSVNTTTPFTNPSRIAGTPPRQAPTGPNTPLTNPTYFKADDSLVFKAAVASPDPSESSQMLPLHEWDLLQKAPSKITLFQLNRLMDNVSKYGSPESVSMGMLRLGILARARELSLEKLIESLELMSSNHVPDHLFFKEIGRLLRAKVSDLTVGQICRILRAHALVNCHEAELFHPIHDRLSFVVNKSTLPQLVDILHSVSLVESSTFDCLNIAELCLNRYSLSLRDTPGTVSTAIESRILAAMSRMRLLHLKTTQKMLKRLAQFNPSVSPDTIVSINNHLASLDCRPSDLIPLPVKSNPTTVSIPTVLGFHPTAPVLKPILSAQVSAIMAYKSRMALAAYLSLHDDKILQSLSLEDLKKLRDIVFYQQDSFREKTQTFFDYRGVVFEKQSVAGIFSINVARVLSKQERSRRVVKKR